MGFYGRIGQDSKVKLVFVIIGVVATLYTAYDYFQRRSVIFRSMPEWVEVGVEAVYDDQTVISPGTYNETILTWRWEIVKVFTRSFQVNISSAYGSSIVTIDTDSPGAIHVCLFDYESEVDIVTAEEGEIEFGDFGKLMVVYFSLEDDDSIYTGIYEIETGIMLQLECQWKGQYLEGEMMGYLLKLRDINIEF